MHNYTNVVSVSVCDAYPLIRSVVWSKRRIYFACTHHAHCIHNRKPSVQLIGDGISKRPQLALLRAKHTKWVKRAAHITSSYIYEMRGRVRWPKDLEGAKLISLADLSTIAQPQNSRVANQELALTQYVSPHIARMAITHPPPSRRHHTHSRTVSATHRLSRNTCAVVSVNFSAVARARDES